MHNLTAQIHYKWRLQVAGFTCSQRCTWNKIFQYGAGGTVLLNITEINFQKNGSALLKACKLCIPSYQWSCSNLFWVAVFERNRSIFKISLSLGIHTRNRFSPHKHVRVISNYEGFLKGYTAEFFGSSVLVWFWLGLFCCWCCLLFLLPSYLFYLTFPLKIYLHTIFNGSVLLKLHKIPRTNKKK